MLRPMKNSELERAVDLLERGDWQGAHEIVQKDEDSNLSCWAHGIVHMLEGDLGNARYWYRRAHRVFPKDPDAQTEIAALAVAVKESTH